MIEDKEVTQDVAKGVVKEEEAADEEKVHQDMTPLAQLPAKWLQYRETLVGCELNDRNAGYLLQTMKSHTERPDYTTTQFFEDLAGRIETGSRSASLLQHLHNFRRFCDEPKRFAPNTKDERNKAEANRDLMAQNLVVLFDQLDRYSYCAGEMYRLMRQFPIDDARAWFSYALYHCDPPLRKVVLEFEEVWREPDTHLRGSVLVAPSSSSSSSKGGGKKRRL